MENDIRYPEDVKNDYIDYLLQEIEKKEKSDLNILTLRTHVLKKRVDVVREAIGKLFADLHSQATGMP